jgi:multiple sugar transport system ATP-binding protein
MAGPLTLALRPEDLQPVAQGLPAVAEGIEFLGESLLLHARMEDGTALVLRLAPETRGQLAPGARLALGFDRARALLFGADGRRVAARIAAAEPALV